MEFRDIKGFEGLYKISDDGKVFSIRRNKILIPKIDKYGYYSVVLYKNKNYCRTIHRLVAETFIDNPNNYPVVNHKDSNKLNNSVDNLEWCTVRYNTIHAYNNNKEYHDRTKNLWKLSLESVCLKIDAFFNGEFLGSFNSKKETAQALNISEKTIYNRLHNRFNSKTGYTFKLRGD